MFNSSDFKVVDGVPRLVEMYCYWVTFVSAFAVYVGAVTSHSVLKFLTCFPDVLDAASGTFDQVDDIAGGAGDGLIYLEGLL